MEILLLKPIISSYYVISPNLGLGYLARIARDSGHEVSILDSGQAGLSWDDFQDRIRKGRFELVGLQCFTHEVGSVARHVRIIREQSPETTVVIGGPQPSAIPEDALRTTGADFAFRGEAEVGFGKLLEIGPEGWKSSSDLKSVPGLCTLNPAGAMATCNPPAPIEDLDRIPFPLWEQMDPNTYPLNPHGTFCRRRPVAPIIVSRGCPFQCTFCGGHTITGRKIRYRSVQNVLEEVTLLHGRYGVRELHIEDDNFTLKREIVTGFCEELIRLRLGLSLSCPNGVRLDALDPELVRLMEQAGFYSLALGIEFGTDRLLKLTRKNLTVASIAEQVSMIKKTSSIRLTGFFLLGHPEESKEDLVQTIRFARRLQIDKASFMPLMPLPGSAIWDAWDGKETVDRDGWENFFYYRTLNISKIPDKTLRRLQVWAMLSFYLRPWIFAGVVRELLSWQQVRVLAERVTNMFFERGIVRRTGKGPG